jgi:tetratricopeptide (TPR) repeat protein
LLPEATVRSACLLFFVASVVSRVELASAQAPSEADDLEARSLYEAGARAYDSGRYDRALDYFRRAYELSGRAALLFNVGQAAEHLRLDREALEAYERYLAAGPEPAVRAQVEARVAILHGILDAPDDAPAQAAPSETAAEAPPPSAEVPATAWVVAIGGAIVAAGGAVLIAVSQVEGAAVRDAPDGSAWPAYAGRVDAANALLGVGIATAIVGAVAGTIGVVWIATASGAGGEARVALGPGGVSVAGRF